MCRECRVYELPEAEVVQLVNLRFSPRSKIARTKPLKAANKPKSLDAMRNWLKHDGCYDDYRPTLPHFENAAIAHMQYGKLPSTRELHVGKKMQYVDRKPVKENYMGIHERWAEYLARCQEVYDDW